MEGKFTLRKDCKPNEFGEYPVVLNYCTMGKSVRKTTKIRVVPEHWLGDNGCSTKYVKGGKDGNPKAEILNNKLNNFKRTYDNLINEIVGEGNNILTVSALRAILNGTYQQHKEEKAGKVPFVEFVLEYNEELYKMDKIGISVWDNVKCYMNKFNKFLRTDKRLNTDDSNIFYCCDLCVELLKDYIIWRKEVEGNCNSTVNKALSPIIKAAKACCKRGWITRDEYEEISELYLNENARSYDDSTEKKFLTIEQLRDFKKQAEKMNRQRTMDFADMFLFSSFTGLRVSDLLSLKWREVNMEGNMISHKQYKGHNRTPKMLSIPLNPVSKGILDKWKGRYDEFVFGMLPSGYDLGDDVDFKKVKEGKTRTINQSLSMLGDKMRLPFKLHIHCGRHTFSMLALNGGVDIKTTSAILGHASTIVTEKVYASLLPNTIAENVGDRLNIEI